MSQPAPTAAYCGLFCESCSFYIGTTEEPERLEAMSKRFGKNAGEMRCRGCRSDTLTSYCLTCEMKSCAALNGIDFCIDCRRYPCETIVEFQKKLPHRIELFDSLEYYKSHGYDGWYDHMRQNYACESCGTINPVYDSACRRCGHTPPNPYVQRNGAAIAEMMSKTTHK